MVNWLATKASQWVNGWKNVYTFYACCLEFQKKLDGQWRNAGIVGSISTLLRLHNPPL